MSLQSKILLVCAIGAALLIAGCGSSSNTRVTGGQAADVGTEVMTTVLQTFKTANSTNGVEPAPSEAARAAVTTTNPVSCTGGNCTYATTTFPCPYSLTADVAGEVSLGGTFSESKNTTTGIETVTDENFTLSFANPPSNPPGCSYDDIVVLTSGSVLVTGTNTEFDTNTGNIVLPFTLNAAGTVKFAPGAADTTFPTGVCEVNITAIYEFVSTPTTACSTEAPCQVQAAVSGNVCGKTIPADTVIPIGGIS
jgi:hypothetical protein